MPGLGRGMGTKWACDPGRGKATLGPGLIYKVGREGAQHLFEGTQCDSAKQGIAFLAEGTADAKAWRWE